MKYLGIDPGISGGAAVLDSSGQPLFLQSFADCTPKDTADLFRKIQNEYSPITAALEQVHAFPGQGVSSTFKFGEHYGMLIGILSALEIPYILYTPTKWQKRVQCLNRSDKKVTRLAAQRLFPAVKITHAVADALLIGYALYLERKPYDSERDTL